MCGKFTAMYSWREVHAFSQPLGTRASTAGANDEVLTYTPARPLPVIIFDRGTRERRIVPMRWGWPRGRNPYDMHIHARSEAIDQTRAFADAFQNGRRGIVVFRTFNEGREIIGPKGGKKTEQWTINPNDGQPRGFAFLWQEFEIEGKLQPCCVMVTVAASALIAPITDRMPAILRDEDEHDDWRIWLGEESAELADVKAVLQTMENIRWTIAPEKKCPPPKSKPQGLF